VENAFSALGDLPEDPKEAWSITYTRYHIDNSCRKFNVPVKRAVCRFWLTTETMDIIAQKKEARLKGYHDEWKRLKGVYKARSKVDLEHFYGKLAAEAESGFRKNNLRPAYRTIERLHGSTRSNANGSVARSDGSLCNTPAEITERWREHYENTLNHSNVTPSADLDDFADSVTPDVTVSEDVHIYAARIY